LKLAKQGAINTDEYVEIEKQYINKNKILEKNVLQNEKLNEEGVSNLDVRGDEINSKMLNKHKSHGILDLVKMSISSPMKNQPIELNNKPNLNIRRSNMAVSKTPVQKFDAERFHSKFNQLGKDIVNMELKTKNYARTIGRNGRFCDKAFSNMGSNINTDNKLLNFADVVTKVQVLDKEMLVNDILEIQKYKKNTINLKLIEIDHIKIKKSKEVPIEDLIKNSTRVHAIVLDEDLDKIKSDFLEQEEIEKLPIKVYYCFDKFHLGLVTRFDIQNAERNFRKKLSDINSEIRSSKRV